jgi:hypothetical protein
LLFQILFAFGSDSDIQLLLSSWLVKYLAGFGKFRSSCAKEKILTFGSLSSLCDIAATCNVSVAVIPVNRYPP